MLPSANKSSWSWLPGGRRPSAPEPYPSATQSAAAAQSSSHDLTAAPRHHPPRFPSYGQSTPFAEEPPQLWPPELVDLPPSVANEYGVPVLGLMDPWSAPLYDASVPPEWAADFQPPLPPSFAVPVQATAAPFGLVDPAFHAIPPQPESMTHHLSTGYGNFGDSSETYLGMLQAEGLAVSVVGDSHSSVTGSNKSPSRKRRPSMHLDLSNLRFEPSMDSASSAGSKRFRATPSDRYTPMTSGELYPLAKLVQVVDQRSGFLHPSLDLSWISQLNASAITPPPTYVRGAVIRFFSACSIESAVNILVPRVGQKSYGNEKRFFCPPPMVSLEGPASYAPWDVTMSPHASGIHGADSCGGIAPTRVSGNTDALVFKNFHISDLKRAQGETGSEQRTRKDFELHVRIGAHGGNDAAPEKYIGTLVSPSMTLISKPSKKKPLKSVTMPTGVEALIEDGTGRPRMNTCVDIVLNGSMIALFNRQKSQTVSTKFMVIDGGALVSKHATWEPVVIQLVRSNGDMVRDVRPVCFGDKVVLKCPRTNWQSSPLTVFKADRSPPEDDQSREVIVQLQKIAFRTSSNQYLGINGTEIKPLSSIVNTTNPPGRSSSRATEVEEMYEEISETMIWTVVSVEQTSYRWYDLRTASAPQLPLSPYPTVRAAQVMVRQDMTFPVMMLDIALPSSAVVQTQNAPWCFEYFVYAGNVMCPVIHNDVFTPLPISPPSLIKQRRMQCEVEENIYRLRLACRMPTWNEAVCQGQWFRNLPLKDPVTTQYRNIRGGRLYPTPDEVNLQQQIHQAFLNSDTLNASGPCVSPSWIFPCKSSQNGMLTPSASAMLTPLTGVLDRTEDVASVKFPLAKSKIIHRNDGTALVTVPLILVRAVDGLVIPTSKSAQFIVPNAVPSDA